MPYITVSTRTHERMEKVAITGRISHAHSKVNGDGTVTFWIDDQVKDRLAAISNDPERAIVRALDAWEGRKSDN